MTLTLADHMALAILRGDRVAAYALADLLKEERDGGTEKMSLAAQALREHTTMSSDGYSVYRWPEFRAFCKRAGILWDLRTVSITIRIAEGELLVVDHQYAASDDQRPAQPESIDTTTLQTEYMRTSAPPADRGDQ